MTVFDQLWLKNKKILQNTNIIYMSVGLQTRITQWLLIYYCFYEYILYYSNTAWQLFFEV